MPISLKALYLLCSHGSICRLFSHSSKEECNPLLPSAALAHGQEQLEVLFLVALKKCTQVEYRFREQFPVYQ